MRRIPVPDFLALSPGAPLLDVRSPGEYNHAHIPGAHSIPIFSDEERAAIGTAYKHQSRETAIKIGLDAFGPKMRSMVEAIERISAAGINRTVGVHCWRGGMRSEAVAWLLNLYGFDVFLLEGGYKAYRNWAISHWTDNPLRVLCGMTGSGKTEILLALKALGEPVIDLEGLACHKGSAFGGLDQIARPTQEQFENLLAGEIAAHRIKWGKRPIWIEDESQRIGDINLPHLFFKNREGSSCFFLERDFESRLDRVVAGYGEYSIESLINAITRIKKRLGPLETKTAIAHLVEGEIREAFRILLRYYDRYYYPYGTVAGQYRIDSGDQSAAEIAAGIQQKYL